MFGKTFYWHNHCHRKAPAIIVISGAFLLGKTFYLIFT
ncbi:putative membrane protein [Serratia plymuthica A30]|nr:putative membrane protein [Serratia plymuthica A30]